MKPLQLSRNRGAFVGIGAVLIFLCFVVGDRVLNGSRAEVYHQRLTREFQSIQPLPGAVVITTSDRFSVWKPGQILIDVSYTTQAPYSEIRHYYDQELTSKGWRFVDDRPYTVWGKDMGGRLADYCKGPLSAELEYAGSQPGRTYSLSLSWGLGHKCDSGK